MARVRYFEHRGLHYRHWKGGEAPPLAPGQRGEQRLAALAYVDVARRPYEALVAAWLPPATWTVLDGRGPLSIAWALRSAVHWNRGSWAWRRRKACTIDQELALALGARWGRSAGTSMPRSRDAFTRTRPPDRRPGGTSAGRASATAAEAGGAPS